MPHTELDINVNPPIITVGYDDDASDPRDDYHVGYMVCEHRRYELPNECEHDVQTRDFDSWADMRRYLVKVHNAAVILPVYMYDHSAIALSTVPFSCRWDSGQVGWIYATRSDVLELAGTMRITAKARRNAERALREEVAVYSGYQSGAVYSLCMDDTYIGGFYDCAAMHDYVPAQYHGVLAHAIHAFRNA